MDKETWEDECQSFELDFHSRSNYRWNKEQFWPAWEKHFAEWCGFGKDAFDGKVVIDVGCGSVPAIDYFDGAVKYYMDPLIDKYIHIEKVAEYWDSEHLRHSISSPAETFWQLLEGAASMINAWNMLDHCYDWRAVVKNLGMYARSGCFMCLSTDYAPHKGHVGIDDTEELFITLAVDWEVIKDEPSYWGRDMALLLRRK
jgi:hypothetical protein